jgi:hypothetical protein
MLYYTLAITPLFTIFFSKNKTTKILSFLFITYFLTIIMGLREGIGTDYYNYLRIFNKVSGESIFSASTEIGYWIMNAFFYNLGSYKVLIFFVL